MTSSVNNDSLEMQCIVMDSALNSKLYSKILSPKVNKANFRTACKRFSVANAQLIYKGNRLAVRDKQRRIDIIHDVYQELGNTVKTVPISSHLGRTFTYQKVSSRFYWYTSSTIWQTISKAAIIGWNIHQCQKKS